MDRENVRTLIAAATAIALVLLALTFVAANPWMLVGIAAVLLAVAAIIRAILGSGPAGTDADDDLG